MNFQNLIDQLMGGGPASNAQGSHKTGSGSLDSITSAIPGGLAGGAAAGGIIALLMGNKSARKMAGKVAKYGGTALLGGIAYKAYQNWRHNQSPRDTQPVSADDIVQAQAQFAQQVEPSQPALQLTLIKSMIAAAKSDGQIDSKEQKSIFDAVNKMQLGADEKAIVFDSMSRNITVEELADSITSVEHRAEVYLAGYLAIDPDQPAEVAHLNDLAVALELPPDFVAHLEQQVKVGVEATA